MDLAAKSIPLVATVFASVPQDEPFGAFREFLRKHMISFTSARILKSASAMDPLVVTEYYFSFESSLPSELTTLRKSAYEWGKPAKIDVAIQLDDVFRRYKRLVVFDMDSTLIKQEVIDEIALHLDSIDPQRGVGVKVAVVPEDEVC